MSALTLLGQATALAQVSTISNLWTLKVGSYSDSSPAIGADGTIYFGTFSGRLWAVSPEGKRKWTFATGRGGAITLEIRSSPAVGADGTIYFGARDNRFYAVTPAGRKKWDFKTEGWVDSSAAIGSDGTLYFGSWDENFYAVTPQGTRKWAFATGGIITSSPAIDAQGIIYFGSHDHKFYALNPDGSKAWEFAAGRQIISSPAIDANGNIYFTALDGYLYALKPGGELLWKLKTAGSTESSPVIGHDGTIYLGVNKNIWAVSPAGEKVWDEPVTTDAYQEPVLASPLVLKDASVCVVSGFGWITSIAQDLRRPWGYYLKGHYYASPAVGPTGTIYVPGHILHAIDARVPVAKSPWPKFRGNPANTGNVTPTR